MNVIKVKMQNRIVYIFFSFGIFFFSSCNNKPKELNDKDYCSFIENVDNGAVEKTQLDKFEFSVMYKPVDYVIELENRNKPFNPDSILKRKNELKGYQYYTFRIRSLADNEFFKTGIQNDNEY